VELISKAIAGTLESSDIQITIEPLATKEVVVELQSSVEKQFGRRIREVIKAVLAHYGVEGVRVHAVDKGALDCTIRARMVSSLHRAAQIEKIDWKELDSWNV
jgi:citrate lyase subunit gamma (acyl carrier protein)